MDGSLASRSVLHRVLSLETKFLQQIAVDSIDAEGCCGGAGVWGAF